MYWFRNQRGEVDIVGPMIGIMISIVVAVSLIPIISSALGVAKKSLVEEPTTVKATETITKIEQTQSFSIPDVADPNTQLIFLTILLTVLLIVVFIVVLKRKKEARVW